MGMRPYPWEVWFSRGNFKLLPKRDYHCMPHSMGVQIRGEAKRRRKRVSIEIGTDGIITVTQNPRKVKR